MKLNEALTNIAIVESIKKDRDERLAVLKDEVEELKKKVDTHHKSEIQMQVKLNKQMIEHTQLKNDYRKSSEDTLTANENW